MFDACIIRDWSQDFNSFSEEEDSWTDRIEAVPCGLDMRPGSVTAEDNMTLLVYDATLRLPSDTVINEKDRVKIIGRFGEVIAPIEFSIAGSIQRGPSGLRVKLRKAVI